MQSNAKPIQASTPVAPPVQSTTLPTTGLEALSYPQLKARQTELQDQRQALANRRANVAQTYERATGASKDGIAQRLAVMDRSMAQFESDLSAVGLAMVPKRSTEAQVPPPSSGNRARIAGGEAMLIAVAIFVGTMLVAVPASVRRAKRRWMRESPSEGTLSLGAASQRLDRIEHAVDTIAVEIERVSENQRFMTRLMTETQLAGTIAAVRGSTEMAKDAAKDA